MRSDVLVVGTGHAGAQSAIMLRQLGFEGSVTIVGEEAEPPYERPPLSKEYFAGDKGLDRIRIRPPAFWPERGIDLRLGTRIVAVNARERTATAADGSTFGYGTLIWAAGGHARSLPLPGGDLPGVQGVRTLADADAMRASATDARAVAVIGGGYIGLEAAAVLAKAGKQVTLLEAQPRVLARVAGEPLSRFFEAEHRAHGVDVRLGVKVARVRGVERVEAVELADAPPVAADLVVVGIGIRPAVEPLLAAGAAGGDGVDVDALCRTSLPGIFAVGDCARHASRFAGGARVRIESVQNANDMANTVARAICGDAQDYAALPWFWSNQYDLRLQTVGLSSGHDAAVTRGDPAARSFSVVYLRDGRVIALDCVNATKDYVQGRALVLGSVAVDPAMLADTSIPLKELAGG